jgi:hypothetical protein
LTHKWDASPVLLARLFDKIRRGNKKPPLGSRHVEIATVRAGVENAARAMVQSIPEAKPNHFVLPVRNKLSVAAGHSET